MARPSSRAELKEYCLRQLGKPVIEINVDPDQVEDRIDEALQYFAQYHYDGIKRVYLKHELTESEIARMTTNTSVETATDDVQTGVTADFVEQNNWIPIPQSVLSIVQVFPLTDSLTQDLFDVRYQLRLNDLYDFSSTSIIHYEMTMRHLDYLDHILVGEMPIQYRQHENRLYLYADIDANFNAGDYILIEAYRELDPSDHSDVFNDIFLKRYCTQLIKRQWGANLSKFEGVQMLGGVTLNGAKLYEEANEELNKLEEQIQLAYELPPQFMQG